MVAKSSRLHHSVSRADSQSYGFESLEERVFVLGEEVAVAVEDYGDAGVAGADRDLFRVGAGGDPQGYGGVAQVVHAKRCESPRV